VNANYILIVKHKFAEIPYDTVNLRERFKNGRIRLENDQIQPNLPDRSEVYRMAADYGILSELQAGSTTQMENVANPECDRLCESHRLPMAHVAG